MILRVCESIMILETHSVLVAMKSADIELQQQQRATVGDARLSTYAI